MRRTARRVTTAVLAAGVGLCAVVAPARAQRAYVVDASQRFGTIDLATGAFLAIGPGLPQGTTGLAQGANGALLSLGFNGDLLAIDPATGIATTVGPTGLADCSAPSSPCGPMAANTLTSFGGVVYAADFQNHLYTLDPRTGTATLVGATGMPAVPFTPGFPSEDGTLSFYDEALFPVGDALFATFDAGILDFATGAITTVIAPSLFRIDPATGRATRIAETALGLHAALAVEGVAYAFNIQSGEVVTLGLTDGRTTPVSRYGNPTEFIVTGAALAPTVTPEPASMALVAVGMAAIAGRRRRVRRR